jgi:hypothetical protein
LAASSYIAESRIEPFSLKTNGLTLIETIENAVLYCLTLLFKDSNRFLKFVLPGVTSASRIDPFLQQFPNEPFALDSKAK